MTTTVNLTATWPTYIGIDGLERPVPTKTCKFCEVPFPSHYPQGMGNCGNCPKALGVKKDTAFWLKAAADLDARNPESEDEDDDS